MNYANDFITYNKIIFDSKNEVSAESEVLLPDYYAPIMKIVKSEAIPFIRSQSAYGEKLVLEGNVEFRLVYQSEDSSLNSIFTRVPFSQTSEVKGFQENFPVSATVNIAYHDIRALSPQKIHVKATVSVHNRILSPEKVPVLTLNYEDGIAELKEKRVSYCKSSCFGKKSLRISDELDLGSRPAADKILKYEIDFSNIENKLLSRKIISKSDMALKIIYLAEDGNNPEVFEQKIPVSQILDIDGLEEDSLCCVSFKPAECKLEIKENADGGNKVISYDIEVNVNVFGYETIETDLIDDAFGVKKEIECVKKTIQIEKALPQNENVSFTESLDIGENKQIYDISIKPKLNGFHLEKETNSIISSGNFICSALLKDNDDELRMVEKSIPFALKTDVDHSVSKVRGDVEIALLSSAFVPIDASKLDLRINCNVQGCLFITEEVEALSEIKPLEDIKNKRESDIILYYAQKGEPVWDIAKKYHTSPAIIKQHNEIEEDIIATSTMLLITD